MINYYYSSKTQFIFVCTWRSGSEKKPCVLGAPISTLAPNPIAVKYDSPSLSFPLHLHLHLLQRTRKNTNFGADYLSNLPKLILKVRNIPRFSLILLFLLWDFVSSTYVAESNNEDLADFTLKGLIFGLFWVCVELAQMHAFA